MAIETPYSLNGIALDITVRFMQANVKNLVNQAVESDKHRKRQTVNEHIRMLYAYTYILGYTLLQ